MEKQPENFFTCRIISPVEHKRHTFTCAPEHSHKPSSLGIQFLKAPHLLALAINSFSRGPSICQNAAVCVTSVKWLMQNLKQNSSKSWTQIKTRRGLFLLTLIELLIFKPLTPYLSPSLRKDIWGQKPQTRHTSDQIYVSEKHKLFTQNIVKTMVPLLQV